MTTLAPRDWNQRYETGQLPWDTGEPDGNLLETLKQLALKDAKALEIGCGTGTNAIALARHGFSHVTATDLSPKAIEMAVAKAKAAGATSIDFKVHDIIASLPEKPASVGFVFDRGVFHSVSDEQRATFARHVAQTLTTHGWWLSLCGNADDKTEGGPPRLTAAHIASVVEPLFEVHAITRSQFRKVKERTSDHFMCWRVLLRKR